ncbi:MAG: SRPBCC family protein [Acidimicrobiia bacterium]|nr:SRPBCC family protein [Acidimicrobiia bacterium]
MSEFSFSFEATAHASPEAVFAILADATRWKEWAGWFIRDSWWEREGTPPPGGVGAIKRLGTKVVGSREETVEYEPPKHYAYRIVSGQPVKNYRADVELTPVDGGTHIRWSSRFEPTVPGTGPFMRWYLGRIVAGLTRRLAAHASQTAS